VPKRKSRKRRNLLRKQALYFPDGMHVELRFEAARTGRSLSWLMARAWVLAREKLRMIDS
jgi:uncharacterized small protein (TIGR04563 family)